MLKKNVIYTLISIFIAVFAFLGFRLLSIQHGLIGKYYISPEKEGSPLHTQIDPNISFNRSTLLRSVYLLNWDLDKFPFPERIPQYSISWKGFIKIPGSQEEEVVKKRGFAGKYYYGTNFSGNPFLVGSEDRISFDWKMRKRPNLGPFSVEWTGFITIVNAGLYTFATRSDDSSSVYLGDKLVVDNSGGGGLKYKSGAIYLSRGDHKIRVRYSDIGREAVLHLFWIPPGEREKLLPGNIIYHTQSNLYAFAIESNGRVLISLGDEVVLKSEYQGLPRSSELKPGVYPISIEYTGQDIRNRATRDDRIILSWITPDGKTRVISRKWFFPTQREISSIPWKRIIALFLVVLAVGFVIWINFIKNRISSFIADYLRFIWSKKVYFALVLIVLLGGVLRFHQYDIVPFHGETYDEYFIAWLGWNLIHRGVPATAPHRGFPPSLPSRLKDRIYEEDPGKPWFGERFTIGGPKFHPAPLYSVIVAAVATWGGANKSFFESSLSYMRLPSIFFTVLSTFFVFALGKRLYNEWIGLLAGLLFATIPLIVVSGRLTKEENLLVLLSLLAVLSILKYLDSGESIYRNLGALIAGLAPLVKATGVSIIAIVIILLFFHKKWKDLVIVSIISGALFSLYLLYAWWYGWGFFRYVPSALYSLPTRRMDFAVKFIREAKIVVRWFGGGWILWLWMAAIYTTIKKDRVIFTAILLPMLTLSVMISSTTIWDAWHKIPIYPYLCIAGAVFLYDLFRKPDLFRSVIFIVLVLMTSLQYYLPSRLTSSNTFILFVSFISITPFFLHSVFNTKFTSKMAKLYIGALFFLFIILNILIAFNFLDIYSTQSKLDV